MRESAAWVYTCEKDAQAQLNLHRLLHTRRIPPAAVCEPNSRTALRKTAVSSVMREDGFNSSYGVAKNKKIEMHECASRFFGDPYGNRTHDFSVRG